MQSYQRPSLRAGCIARARLSTASSPQLRAVPRHDEVRVKAFGRDAGREATPTSTESAEGGQRFDLATAIALAAVSFEAYLDPCGAQEDLTQVLLNDTHVTFTDRYGQQGSIALPRRAWACAYSKCCVLPLQLCSAALCASILPTHCRCAHPS